MNIVDEQRKRREFLYHIYKTAQWFNGKNVPWPINCAHTMTVYDDMQRNWSFFSNASGAPLLYYHLAEGNISITTPHPEGVDVDALSDEVWRYDQDSIFPERIFITSKGINVVESDQELLACLIYDGAAIDWRKAEISDSILSHHDMISLTKPKVSALGKRISDLFNEDELRDLARKLSIDYENLSGDNKLRKTHELVEHCVRHEKVLELLSILQEERPRVNWVDYLN